MTATENLAELAEFLASDALALEAATVSRGRKGDDLPEARSLNLAVNAKKFFRDAITKSVGSKLTPELSWTLREFDALYKPDKDQVEWALLADVDPVKAATDRYANLAPLAPFDGADDAYIKRLKYWVIVLTHPDGRKAFFFRAFSAAAELERKPGAALVARQGTFHRVEDRIFLFDETVDCFVFGDYLYVARKLQYRRIFDQLALILTRAKAAAGDLHSRLPIANFDDFADACATDSRLADKILAVRKRDYFDQLSYAMVKPVIEEFNLQIGTQTTPDGAISLVFRSEPNHRFRILKLVDDDFLRSSMTQHLYEVNSKTEPPN